MDDLTLTVTLFAEPGPQNTEATLRRALERARELSLEHVVVATDSGKTARRALEVFAPGFTVIAVSNPPGMELPLEMLHDYLPRFREHRRALATSGVRSVPASLSQEAVTSLEQRGAKVCRVDWQGVADYTQSDLGALDRVGIGLRVALTCCVAAQLRRQLAPGLDVLALAGTGFGGGGADTAIVVRTAAAWPDWRVLELIARPRVSPPSER